MTKNEPKNVDTEAVEPTEEELAIAKYEKNVRTSKHITAFELATNFMFPLFRKLAKRQGEQDDLLAEIEEQLKKLSGGDVGDVLEDVREVIFVLASLLDEAVVVAGLFEIVKGQGLVATKTADVANIRPRYMQAAQTVAKIVPDIEAALDALDDGGDDGDGGDGEQGGDPDDQPGAPPVSAEPGLPPIDSADVPSKDAASETTPST